MKIRLHFFVVLAATLIAPVAFAQQELQTLQRASLLFGQQSFYHGDTTRSDSVTTTPISVGVSPGGLVAVGEDWPGRVLIWKEDGETVGTSASLILGEPNPGSNSVIPSAAEIGSAAAILFTTDGRMIVADAFHNRVLIWTSLASAEASIVIGQEDFVSDGPGTAANRLRSPSGLALTPDGRLVISDTGNNRVLVFNRIPEYNGAAADVVIGQNDMTTSAESELYEPRGVAVSREGTLAIADSANDRVLIHYRVPWSNGVPADSVIDTLGWQLSKSGLGSPMAVAFSSFGTLAVSDTNHHRVLLYEREVSGTYRNALTVLGQPDFISTIPYNGGAGDQAIVAPIGVAYDIYGRLFATGRAMRRTMGFGTRVPVITSISPGHGPAVGGTSVLVSGSGLYGSIGSVGDRPASFVTTSSGSIVITMPALQPGTLNDVTLRAGMQHAVLRNGWFAEFNDVPSSHPFAAGVEAMVRAQVTAGCGNGSFCAERPVTRAEAAVLVERTKRGLSFRPATATGGMFVDVPANSFAASWIEQLASDGITGGCAAYRFCPNGTLTHAQVAVFAVAAKYGAGFVPPNATGRIYLDIARDSFAAAYAEKLAADGVALSSDRYFRPDAPTTRAELAHILTKMFGLQK